MKQKRRTKATTMTPKAYREAIAELGLTQIGAAAFFGFSPRHGQNMALGETRILPAIVHLLTLMKKHNVAPSDLDERFASK